VSRCAPAASRSPEAPDPSAATGIFTLGELPRRFRQASSRVGRKRGAPDSTEYKLLRSPGGAGSGVPSATTSLLREVWGPEFAEQVEYLRTFMRQLRYKLEPEPFQPRYLVTIRALAID